MEDELVDVPKSWTLALILAEPSPISILTGRYISARLDMADVWLGMGEVPASWPGMGRSDRGDR
jgi:hypothetical protein